MPRDANDPLTTGGLYPNAETVLAATPITSDADVPVALPAGASVLMVYSDQDFVEGRDAPNRANCPPRAASTLHFISCLGAATWHFAKASSGGTNLTLKIKVLQLA